MKSAMEKYLPKFGATAWNWLALASITLACIASRLIKHLLGQDTFFWDYWVYQATVKAIRAGLDPYILGVIQTLGAEEGYNFTYPPIVIDAMYSFSSLNLTFLLTLYSILFYLSIVCICFISTKLICGHLKLSDQLCAIVASLSAFTMAGTIAASSANLGVILGAFIITGLAHALRTNAWSLFYFAVVIGASVKLFYLGFIIIPFILYGLNKPFFFRAVISITASFMIYIVYYFTKNEAMMSWMDSISNQSFDKGVSGDNIFGLALRFGANEFESLAIHGVFCLALIFMAFRIKSDDFALKLSVAIIVAVFLNPRLMMYDVFLAAIPVFYILRNELLRYHSGSILRTSTIVASFLFLVGLLSLRGYEMLARSLTFPLLAFIAVAFAQRAPKFFVKKQGYSPGGGERSQAD